MFDGLLTILVVMVSAFWVQGMLAKENARAAGKKACKEAEVQLLDDTVQQQKTWLGRTSQGWLQVRRIYLFEFTSDGEQRYQGKVTVHGHRATDVEFETYRILD